MQQARRGHIHRVWEHIVDNANENDVVRFTVLGQSIVVLCTPRVIDAFFKQHKWAPKNPGTYNVFKFFVCSAFSVPHVCARCRMFASKVMYVC